MDILVQLHSTLLGEALAVLLRTQTPHRVRTRPCSDPPLEQPPELVLCDGINCREEGRCRWPEARVLLVVTGADEHEVLTQLVKREVDGVLTADMPPQLLGKALATVERGDFWLPHNNIRKVLLRAGSMRSGRVAELSATQRRIARLVAQGCTNREIAQEVHLSITTVKGHVSYLLRLLNVANRTQLAKVILGEGL